MALSDQRSRQPTTSYTVHSSASVGLTATQVCTPKRPLAPTVRAPYTWTTASFTSAGSGARPTGSVLAVRQSDRMCVHDVAVVTTVITIA